MGVAWKQLQLRRRSAPLSSKPLRTARASFCHGERKAYRVHSTLQTVAPTGSGRGRGRKAHAALCFYMGSGASSQSSHPSHPFSSWAGTSRSLPGTAPLRGVGRMTSIFSLLGKPAATLRAALWRPRGMELRVASANGPPLEP